MSTTQGELVEFSRPIASDSVLYVALRTLPLWQYVLVPALSATVETMIQGGDLSVDLADALDDVGQFLQRLGSEIIDERSRRGMSMPPGPDD